VPAKEDGVAVVKELQQLGMEEVLEGLKILERLVDAICADGEKRTRALIVAQLLHARVEAHEHESSRETIILAKDLVTRLCRCWEREGCDWKEAVSFHRLFHHIRDREDILDDIESSPLDCRTTDFTVQAVATASRGKHDRAATSVDADISRGVTERPSGLWQAQVCFEGKSHYIGLFDSKGKADLAYEIACENLKLGDPHQNGESTEDLVQAAREAAIVGVNERAWKA
jgi:hypothetical protein